MSLFTNAVSRAVALCTLFSIQGISVHGVKVSAADTNWVECPLEASVFYVHRCIACLDPKGQGSENESQTLEHFHLSNDSMGFTRCPTTVSLFTKDAVRKGALILNGRTLDVVTIQRSPFSEVIQGQSGGVSYRGVVFEFLHSINLKYNFSMQIFTPPDGNFGARTTRRGWDGMIGMVLRKEAELGAASFSITLERARAVQFTVAFHQEPAAILIPAPTEGEKLSVLIKPLSPQVWLGLAISILIIFPTFYAFHVWTLSIRWKNAGKPTPRMLSKIGMYITGSLFQQSLSSPLAKTTRLMVGLWWMATLVLANTYVAFLVSLLSVPKLQNAVNSLEQLSEQRRLQWTFRRGTALHALFKSDSSTGIYKLIGDGVNDDNLVETDFSGMEKVLAENWAFIKEKSFLDVALDLDFNVHKKCRLTLAKHDFFTVGIGLIVQKKCAYLQLLDYEISNSISTGIMEKWKSLHWPKQLYCANAEKYIVSTQPRTRKLGLNDVQGAYFILGCGLAAAILTFIFELFLNKNRRANICTIFCPPTSKSPPYVYLR